MKVYEIILEDGDYAYKVFVPARNGEEAIEYVNGNGDIVRIKESDILIDPCKVKEALIKDGFGDTEASIVTRLVEKLR